MITERNYGGEFLISGANRSRSRDQIVVAASQTLNAGAVIAKVTTGVLSAAAAPVAGNTGAATITASPPVAAGTPVGEYIATAVSAGATAEWLLARTGVGVLGNVTTGTPATLGGIGPFTITDAGTDPAIGDQMRIVVSAAAAAEANRYKAVAPAATDGTQVADAILWDAVTTGVGQTAKAAAVTRSAEVDRARLDFGALDAGQIVTAIAQLAAKGIIVRG